MTVYIYKKKTSLYLCVEEFNTAALIVDTEITNKYCKLNRNVLKIATGGRLISWLLAELKRVEELNLGLTNTNPCIGRMEDH